MRALAHQSRGWLVGLFELQRIYSTIVDGRDNAMTRRRLCFRIVRFVAEIVRHCFDANTEEKRAARKGIREKRGEAAAYQRAILQKARLRTASVAD